MENGSTPVSMPAAELIAYATHEERVQAMERDGFIYFPAVLDAAGIAQLRACSDRIKPVTTKGDSIQNAFNRDPLYLEFLDKPGVIDLVEAVLGDDCHLLQMTQWNSGKREEQDMHTDWKPIRLPDEIAADPRVTIPALIVTAHFYLDDIYEDLGPTRIIPGSHRAAGSPDPQAGEWNGAPEQSILCNAGDVVIFRSDVWHRGGANRTDQVRYLLQVHYANRWIAQRFTPFLHFKFDSDILARATPHQRRLLGEHPPGAYA